MADSTRRIPAIVNVKSGTADAAIEALASSDAFELHEVEPDHIADTVRDVVAAGATRVLVAGGDGTIATAAAALAETSTELAVLPGGTLNHFARDLGISVVAAEAVVVATSEGVRGVDVGMVNGRIFLNTSSVGAYVRFVRAREQLEKRFGYRIASALAAVRMLFDFRRIGVELEVDGTRRLYRTPLVFIGVGERELQMPTLGNRMEGGRRGLHVMVVRSNSAGRLLAIGLAAVARGVEHVAHSPELDSFIVDRCRIDLRRRSGRVAVDGELVVLDAPLEFELKRDALQVVCPPSEKALADAATAASPLAGREER